MNFRKLRTIEFILALYIMQIYKKCIELTMLYLHGKDISPRAVRVCIIIKETLL